MKRVVLFPLLLCGACQQGLGPVVPESKVERQMIGLLEKFDRWDYDGDGYLDRKEIQDGINSLKGTQREVKYTAADVIEFYDTNHDGKVSMSEAQAGYARAAEAEAKFKH